MAVTKIIPIRATIQNSVDYICNPNKTDDRLLVHSEHCSPNLAGLEFKHYLSRTRAGGNTIGRHLIQSFAPGEVTPEQAHEIGKKLADEILNDEYAFVLATHVDCGHVHNHFVWCAANIVTHKKYRSNKNTYREIRSISDRLCKENELSVIAPQATKTYGKSYGSYHPEKTSGSFREKLQIAIDNLIPQAQDFENFIKLIESQGYEVKRGKHISFRAEGQERFTRAKSLGENYTEDEIKRRILENPKVSVEKSEMTELPNPILEILSTSPTDDESVSIREKIDIAGNPKFAESRGLEQWAKLQNLKNTAAAFNLMVEYGGLNAFNQLYAECRADVDTISNGIEANNQRLEYLIDLRTDIKTYRRTKPIYKQYVETKFFKERFRTKHNSDIVEYEKAVLNLRDYEKPLPSVKTINTNIEKIKTANVKNSEGLAKKKSELKQLKNIHSHLHYLQREHEPVRERPPVQRKRSHSLER